MRIECPHTHTFARINPVYFCNWTFTITIIISLFLCVRFRRVLGANAKKMATNVSIGTCNIASCTRRELSITLMHLSEVIWFPFRVAVCEVTLSIRYIFRTSQLGMYVGCNENKFNTRSLLKVRVVRLKWTYWKWAKLSHFPHRCDSFCSFASFFFNASLTDKFSSCKNEDSHYDLALVLLLPPATFLAHIECV